MNGLGQMLKILLLGGTGFIGEYLAKRLRQEPQNTVSVVHRLVLPEEKRLPKVSYHQIDLAWELPKLEQVMNDSQMVIILTQPSEAIIKNVITAAKISSFLEKIIYLSTLLLYPESSERQNETVPPEPISKYEENKFLEETLLSELAKDKKIKLCIARLANVYGDVKNSGIVGRIFESLRDDKTVIINGQGRQKRDYIFIEDAVELLCSLIMAAQERQNEIYNVCTSEGYTINDLLGQIETTTKQKINYSYGPPVLEKSAIVGDNSKILSLSSYKLKYNLTDGLEKTYKNFLANLKTNHSQNE